MGSARIFNVLGSSALLLALLAVGCGGKDDDAAHAGGGTAGTANGTTGTSGTAGGSAGDGSAGDGGGGGAGACNAGPLTQSPQRASSPTCRTSPLEMFLTPDIKNACKTDADCKESDLHCLGGTCGGDECATDADCPSGSACSCAADYYGGNALHGNRCVAAECRTDADCQSGLSCEEDFGDYCGGPTGFFCHQPSDTCHTDKDCCDGQVCRYQPTLNHWACEGAVVCAG